jgi:hypothetical protein
MKMLLVQSMYALSSMSLIHWNPFVPNSITEAKNPNPSSAPRRPALLQPRRPHPHRNLDNLWAAAAAVGTTSSPYLEATSDNPWADPPLLVAASPMEDTPSLRLGSKWHRPSPVCCCCLMSYPR